MTDQPKNLMEFAQQGGTLAEAKPAPPPALHVQARVLADLHLELDSAEEELHKANAHVEELRRRVEAQNKQLCNSVNKPCVWPCDLPNGMVAVVARNHGDGFVVDVMPAEKTT